MGLRPDDVLFLYAGRVTPEKNVQTVRAVIAQLGGEHPRVRLLVIGPVLPAPFSEFDEAGRFPFSRFAAEIFRAPGGLRRRYQVWRGKDRAALPEILGCADVFINLSLHHDENFGYAQVEAMACGLPVVATDWGGIKDTVAHGVSGFRIPAVLTDWGVHVDRLRALQHCRELAGSAELRVEMGANARRVAQYFGLELFQHRVLEVFATLFQTRDKRGPAGHGRPVFTPFGAEYNLAFSDVVRANDGAPAAVHAALASYNRDNYELYRRLIGPYTSGPVQAACAESDRLFLTSLSPRLSNGSLQIRDFLWPRSVSLSSTEASLVRTLLGAGYPTKAEVLSRLHPSHPRGAVEEALERLISEGIIFRSPAAEPAACEVAASRGERLTMIARATPSVRSSGCSATSGPTGRSTC